MKAKDVLGILLKKVSGGVEEANDYTDEKVDAFTSNMDYKGSIDTESDLPSGATKGDVYTVKSTKLRYVYDGTEWVEFSNGYAIPA